MLQSAECTPGGGRADGGRRTADGGRRKEEGSRNVSLRIAQRKDEG
jgi:hypothetical protein